MLTVHLHFSLDNVSLYPYTWILAGISLHLPPLLKHCVGASMPILVGLLKKTKCGFQTNLSKVTLRCVRGLDFVDVLSYSIWSHQPAAWKTIQFVLHSIAFTETMIGRMDALWIVTDRPPTDTSISAVHALNACSILFLKCITKFGHCCFFIFDRRPCSIE